MRSLVNRIVTSDSIDVIHADQLTMTQFALPFAHHPDGKPALIFDAHNAVWTIVKRMNETLPFYYKIPLFFEARRIKQYEGKIKGGNILISVHSENSDQTKLAKEIFERSGGHDISYTEEEGVAKEDKARPAAGFRN
jgi:hypothetical protein